MPLRYLRAVVFGEEPEEDASDAGADSDSDDGAARGPTSDQCALTAGPRTCQRFGGAVAAALASGGWGGAAGAAPPVDAQRRPVSAGALRWAGAAGGEEAGSECGEGGSGAPAEAELEILLLVRPVLPAPAPLTRMYAAEERLL